ncbi:diguanylate cyclase [Ideonella sp. A 288]|uniref:GGDEF domain-containing protein n=1 Tax=Ideonella sp. A 288 TaxID=1962181 RepID=UPI001303044D|nr:GGDEF domain-containing protein [Ideonella sp. A 288]
MDPTTVILILALHLVCSGGLMFLIGRNMPGSGLGPWAAGAVLFGVAYIGRLAFGLDATSVLVLLLDLSMVLAALLFIRGLRTFFGRPTLQSRWYLGLLLAFAATHVVAVDIGGAQGRHMVLNFALGLVYGGLAVSALLEVRRQVPQQRPSLWLLGVLMSGQSLLTLTRVVDIGSHGVGALYTGMTALLFYGYSSLTALLLALNLLWMVFVKLNGRLAEMATRDALTGTLNRNGLTAALDAHFSRRDAGALVLMVADLDHFKRINDRWGHAAGDHVLQAVAGVLTHNLRGADFVARMGGEEFLIGCAPLDDTAALHLAERLRGAVAALDLRATDGTPMPCTVSIGVSRPASQRADCEAAIHEADHALYHAKSAGRNLVQAAHALGAVLGPAAPGPAPASA